ncbi:MAG: Gfo/Idh/MocA family oxidoreductase [Verrucomicrobia bacterium]|nr:Gfo/Idh/MocA family oxidoreductase [Verrucomicrobiota bacterium]
MKRKPAHSERAGRQRFWTRREFLRSAGALAAPLIIPSSALGRGGFVAPSERIAMGFIGIGGQGGGHLTGGAWTYVAGGYVGRDDVQVLAVCDAQRERRERAQQRVNEVYAAKFGEGKHAACAAYNDFRDLLARDDIDAVLIASPIHWHGVMTVMAAQAGKDIYCEKPTAITIRESQAMLAAVKRYGCVFQAGTQQRSEYGGKFRRACEIVRGGGIGKLKEVYAFRPGGTFAWKWFGQPKPVPDGLDWDLYLGPAPWQPYAGVANAHMFCGLGDINWGPHHYDFIQWVLDADRSGPVEIVFEKEMLRYRYASGVVVHGCPAPEGGPGGSGGARFIGTDGWVAVDRDEIAASKPDILKAPLAPAARGVYRSDSHSGNFLDSVRTRKRAICDIETAHRSASAVLLGGIALTLKRTLKWNPQRELFINDAEASRLLSATFRPPWTV